MTTEEGQEAPVAQPARRPIRWRGELPWLLAYVPLVLLFTWPVVARFQTEVVGSHNDSWQNLWNVGWIHHALATGTNPFYTHDLWHPTGATMVFQTFDLPDALLGAGLLNFLGPFATYNTLVFWTFFSSGAAMYLLGRGTGASRLASFLSGCAYSFSTYHFAHAVAHLHLLAMQWVPLYMLAFWRILEGARWRWSLAGAVFLTLASLASWYYLIAAFVLSVAAVVAWLLRERGRGVQAFAVRGLALCALYLVFIGPLGYVMVRERAREPFEGAHPATVYSADAESFVFPNEVQRISDRSDRFRRWSGNAGENGTYIGAAFLLFALAGLILRTRRVGAYLLASVLGIALSLGPGLHTAGHTTWSGYLPYAWIVYHVPLLEFMGVPIRFAFVATFGFAAALAPVLDDLARFVPMFVLAPIAALGVLEHTPHPLETSTWPVPAPLVQWGQDPAPFAVIDACRDNRHLWHQFIHHHPIYDGYLSRTPVRLQKELDRDPIAGPLRTGLPPKHQQPFETKTIDFSFRDRVAEGAERRNFKLDLHGTLVVPQAGPVRFWLSSDDGARLVIDGREVIDNGGTHPAREVSTTSTLAAGEHRIDIHYEQSDGAAELRAWWAPGDKPREVLGPGAVPGGFSGTVRFERRETALPRDAALAHLHQQNVRYILQPSEDSHYLAEVQLGLKPSYIGEGVTIYEIPAR